MKYFLDQEFHERFITKGFWKKKRFHIIELISIGLVREDGKGYYAVSKEFDVEAAWKNEWLRKNVLNSIWSGLYTQCSEFTRSNFSHCVGFNVKGIKQLLDWYGKTNLEIRNDIVNFIAEYENDYPRFYGYYADYDWVLFCSLFGSMMELPSNFPKFCLDLKQEIDEISSRYSDWSPTEDSDYPINISEHNALHDAFWNMNFHNFLQRFKNT